MASASPTRKGSERRAELGPAIKRRRGEANKGPEQDQGTKRQLGPQPADKFGCSRASGRLNSDAGGRKHARAWRTAARKAAKRRAAADARSLREARARRRDRPRREPIPPGMYPEKFSEHRIRIVSMLRAWQARPVQPDEDDTYPVTRLIGEAARRELQAVQLPEFFLEWPRRGLLLGLVALACLKREAPAVRGSRREWGVLLGCSAKTAWNDLQYLVGRGWLELLPQFIAQRSFGRHGEVLHHRQQSNWYVPGRKLRAAWQVFCERREAAAQRFAGSNSPIPEVEPARSKGGNDYQASAFGLRRQTSSTPPESKLIHRPLPCPSDAVFDGKNVSPAAIVVLGSPAATTIGAADGGEAVAFGSRQRADHEKPAQRRTYLQDSRRTAPMPDEVKRAIDRAVPDVMTVRTLHELYKREPEMADLARILARNLARAHGRDASGLND